MIIDLKNINKELDSKNFKNILLIDFEGKSDIQTFSMSDGSVPEITNNNLTGEAKNLLNELFLFAIRKNQSLDIITIGVDIFHMNSVYKNDLFEKLDNLLEKRNDFEFIIGTSNSYRDAMNTVERWVENNGKLYFVSMKNEESLEYIKRNKYPNMIAMFSKEVIYPAEILTVDLQWIFNQSNPFIKVEDITKNIKTLGDIPLYEKIFILFFKAQLVNYIKNEISNNSINIDNYDDIAKMILEKTLYFENKYFKIRPTSFQLHYPDIYFRNKYDLWLAYFLNNIRQEIIFEF
jgi:hypothetical protein